MNSFTRARLARVLEAESMAAYERSARLQAVTAALNSGVVHALNGFDRQTLREAAQLRGYKVPPGTPIEAITDQLWESVGR